MLEDTVSLCADINATYYEIILVLNHTKIFCFHVCEWSFSNDVVFIKENFWPSKARPLFNAIVLKCLRLMKLSLIQFIFWLWCHLHCMKYASNLWIGIMEIEFYVTNESTDSMDTCFCSLSAA